MKALGAQSTRAPDLYNQPRQSRATDGLLLNLGSALTDHSLISAGLFVLLLFGQVHVGAQTLTFAGNSQHAGIYDVPAQPLRQIHWSARIDYNGASGSSHYGGALIKPANTVITPVRTNTSYRIHAYDGATGSLKYFLPTDYVMPPHNWMPVYQPVIANSDAGARLYYPGAGGTVYYVDNPDAEAPGTAVQQCFYADLATYQANSNLFKATVFINSPITADTNGNIFFSFRVYTNGATATPPFTSTNGGFARIGADGTTRFVFSTTAANDPTMGRVSHNCA